jgi:hypothetical protein
LTAECERAAGFAKSHAGLAFFTIPPHPAAFRWSSASIWDRLSAVVGEMTGKRINASREAKKPKNRKGRQDKESEQHDCSDG